MDSVKNLNKTESENTFRFSNLSERSAVASNTARHVRAEHERRATPYNSKSSFFREELDHWFGISLNSDFKRINSRLGPLSYSLAHVLHHRDEIVDVLLEAIADRANLAWKPSMSLLGVLARDLREELLPRFSDIITGLRSRIDTRQPEVTAEVFRAVSFVFKFLAEAVTTDPRFSGWLREWAPFISSRKPLVRELTGGALALLLKQHDDAGISKQILALLSSVSASVSIPSDHTSVSDIETYSMSAIDLSSQEHSVEMRDGVAQLLFECLRGPNGSFHSQSPKILKSAFQAIIPNRDLLLGETSPNSVTDNSVKLAEARLNAICAIYQLCLSQRAEIISQCLRYCRNHASQKKNTAKAACEILWHVLLDSINDAARAWSETNATNQLQGKKNVLKTSTSKSAVEGLTSTNVLAHLEVLQSLHLTHLASLLSSWLLYGRGICVPRGAPRLTEALHVLLSMRLWTSKGHAGLGRLFTLRILVSSWPLVCFPNSERNEVEKSKIVDSNESASKKRRSSSRGGEEVSAASRVSAVSRRKKHGKATIDEDDDDDDDFEATIGVRRNNKSDKDISQAFASQFLSSVFALTPDQDQASLQPVAEAISAAMGGVLLASETDEGPVYPNVAIAGHNAEKRVAHVASLKPQALVLSFARSMLSLLTNNVIQGQDANEDDDQKAQKVNENAASLLRILLPHLSSFVIPLLVRSTKPAADVVWSLLLSAADSMAPKGSKIKLEIPGFLDSAGRLIFRTTLPSPNSKTISSLNEAHNVPDLLIAQLQGAGSQIERALEPFVNGPHDVTDPLLLSASEKTLSVVYAAISCTSIVALPKVLSVEILLKLAVHSKSVDFSTDNSDVARLISLSLHIQFSALLNAARIAESADADDFDKVGKLLSSKSFFANVMAQAETIVKRLLEPNSNGLNREALFQDLNLACALAAINSLAKYLRVLKIFKEASSILTVEEGRKVALWLAPAVSHKDHSIRLCALRVLSEFDSESYSAPGADIPITITINKSLVTVLLDSGVRVAQDSSSNLEGLDSTRNLLLTAEALPNSPLYERHKTIALKTVASHLRSKRVAPINVVIAVHHALGLFHAKFAPVWAVATEVIVAAAESFPRTTWSIFVRKLFSATRERPALLDATEAAGPNLVKKKDDDDGGATENTGDWASVAGNSQTTARFLLETRQRAKSMTQSRAERSNTGVVPIRISSLAVATLSGRVNPDAMSVAGTVLSQAKSIAASSFGAGGGTDNNGIGRHNFENDPNTIEAALEPGLPELLHRTEEILSSGLYGLDAGMPEAVLEAIEDCATVDADDHFEGISTLFHVNDSVALGIGEGGSVDSETVHKLLLEALQASPTFAEARTRTLVPLFLSFMRDDFFGLTHNGDPDVAELSLDTYVSTLVERHGESKARRAANAASSSGAIVKFNGVSEAAFNEEIEHMLEQLAIPLGSKGERLSRLPSPAASGRLTSFLRLFSLFTSWESAFGKDMVENVLVCLLTRTEQGVAEWALRALLALKNPHLLPYKSALLRLATVGGSKAETSSKDSSSKKERPYNSTFRDEMTNFPLSVMSALFIPEHRPTVVPVLTRIMFSRMLQRPTRRSRDTPSARRAAVLSYLSSLDESETGIILFLCLRPFLFARFSMSKSWMLKDTVNTIAQVRRPTSEEGTKELVDAFVASFAPVDGPDSVARKFVTGARAVGFLHLSRNLVKSLGSRLVSHLHLVLAAVLGCLRETRVIKSAKEFNDSLVPEEDDGGLTNLSDDNDTHMMTNVESGHEMAEFNDDGASYGVGEIKDEFEQDDEFAAENSLVVAASSLTYKARDIRSLSVQRLTDIFSNFSEYNFMPWLPTLRECLMDAIAMLPLAMTGAAQPSALLQFFVSISSKQELLYVIDALPLAIPAVFACLSAGMPGSAAAFADHTRALGFEEMIENQVVSKEESGQNASGPSQTVLSQAFSFLENILGLSEEDVNAAPIISRIRVHLPFLLRHLCIRLQANTIPSQDKSMLGDDQPLIVPKLKGGIHAFARRQLNVLDRVSFIVAAAAEELRSTGATAQSSAKAVPGSAADIGGSMSVQQLVLLLLPILRSHKPRSIAAQDGPSKGKSQNNRALPVEDEDDIGRLVLTIIQRLAPLLADPRPHLPFFAQLLAPGRRAFSGSARRALISVISALCSHQHLLFLTPAAEILMKLSASNPKRVTELDFDAALSALSTIGNASMHSRLFSADPGSGGLALLLPAIVHQCCFLMLEPDMVVRTSALNVLTSLLKSASVRVSAEVLPVTTITPAVPRTLEIVPFIRHSSSAGDVSLYFVSRLIVPDIRACMETSSSTLRRNFVTLLSDVVDSFKEIGVSNDGSKFATHPDLHSDLSILINKVNVESDVFLNLTHVQIHRRAKALQRIAALVDADSFGLLSLQSFILPITLHALFDESSTGLEIVESKGKSVNINKSGYSAVGGSSGSSSGLHAEAVKLITSISKQLPWESYAQTMRKIMRLASSVSDPTLEKVLVRAVAGIAEGFHFQLSEPSAPLNTLEGSSGTEGGNRGQALMEMGERQFLAQLITSISSGSASGKITQTTSSASALIPKVAPTQANEITEESGDNDDDDDEVDKETADNIEKADLDPVSIERERRVRLQILCGSLLPQLRGLLHRPVPDDEKSESRGSKLLRKSYEVGELRPAVALALIAVLSRLPNQVFEAELPGLIADVCNALRSRSQERRDSARATLARMAGALGPSRLLVILKELRDALREGYQVHIMGHALYDVIASLSSMMQPVIPQIPKAFVSSSSSLSLEDESADELDAKEKIDNEALAPLSTSVGASAMASSALPSLSAGEGSILLSEALPTLLGMLMEDVMGESSDARHADSGYKPSAVMQLKEAKHCKSFDTMEIVARCIPFLPDASIHTLTAPLISAIEDSRKLSGSSSSGEGKAHKVLADVDLLFKKTLIGLSLNPSVTGPFLMLYVHGICSEFLRLSAKAAAEIVVESVESGLKEKKALNKEAAIAAKSAYAGENVPKSVMDAFSRYSKFLKPRGVGKMAPVVQWLVRDEHAALQAPLGHIDREGKQIAMSDKGVISSSPDLTAAMRQRGSGAVAGHGEIFHVLPEPRMTGAGRFVSTAKFERNSGASSAADIPMGRFALSLLLSGIFKGKLSLKTDALQREMADPFIPLLLRLVETSRESSLLSLSLRLLAAMLPLSFPVVPRIGQRLSKAILLSVESSSRSSVSNEQLTGKSELASSALKAATVLLRSCDFIRISDDQLRALLMLLRKDLEKQSRQNATFSLLKAIVDRRLITVEVYDIIDDVARLLVTSLRPNARGLCASVFLRFLITYPMSDKRLQSHLDFFISNLGYEQEDGRRAVLDMLLAIVTRFPQPVLDDFAAVILIPLVVRLQQDPSAACRAAVGQTIRQLFKSTSLACSQGLVRSCLQWTRSTEKASNRRVGMQVLGLAVDGRPEALASSLQDILNSIVSEMKRAAIAVSIEQARLRGEEDVNTPELGNEEGGEEHERALASAATTRALAIERGDTPNQDVIDEDDLKDPVVSDDVMKDSLALQAAKKPKKKVHQLPRGLAGGGSSVFDVPQDVTEDGRTSATPVDVTHEISALIWEPVYYALVAAEKLWRDESLSAQAESLIRGAILTSSSPSSSSLMAKNVNLSSSTNSGGGTSWRLMSDDDKSGIHVPQATCDLLLFPHAWVRLAAGRVFGLFLSRRSIELFSSAAAAARYEESSISKHVLDIDPPAAFLASENTLYTVCMRLCTQLTSKHIGSSIAEQTTKNLIFATLSLHSLVPLHRRNKVDPIVDRGRKEDEASESLSSNHALQSNEPKVDDTVDEKTQDESDEEKDDADDVIRNDRDPVYSVFARACNVARLLPQGSGFGDDDSVAKGEEARAAVLRFVAAVSLRLERNEMLRYVVPIVRLIHRLTAETMSGAGGGGTKSGKQISDKSDPTAMSRGLALESLELLQAQAGSQAVLLALNAERGRVQKLRLDRRKERAVLKITDPEAAGLEKQRRQHRKALGKKRKAEFHIEAKGKRAKSRDYRK